MAKYSAGWNTLSFTAAADAADIADNAFLEIQGGTATMRCNIYEVFTGGEEASTSKPVIYVVSRDSTKGATLSGGSNVLLDITSTAPATTAVVGVTASTTQPQRVTAAGGHLLHLSFNAYGGIVRWVAAPGSELVISTATAPAGALSISGFTGSTASANTSGHILYEVV